MPRKKNVLVLIVSLLIVVGLSFLLLYPSQSAYTKVEGFRYVEPYAPTCMAISPGCGVCDGEVIDKECYVVRKQSLLSSWYNNGGNTPR